MKRLMHGLVWAVAIPLLGVASTATAGTCPAVGQAIYGDYRCSTPSSATAPCLMFVITSVSGGKAHGKYYKNGYYRWVFQYSGSYTC